MGRKTMAATTYTRNGNELKAYDVQPGQVYETSGGERIEVRRDDMDGSKPLLVRYPERTQLDEDGNEVVATARMSRYSFADMATFDGFTKLDERCANEAEEEKIDDPPKVPGRFVSTPNCPRCGSFMGTGWDDLGFPAASCGNQMCDCTLDDRTLIKDGHFIEE